MKRASLAISFGLHSALLASAFIVLPAPEALKVDPQDMIPIDIVSIEDFSARKAMVKAEEPKPVEKPKPKPTPIVAEEPPAPKVAPEIKTAAHEPEAPEPPPVPEKKPEPEPEPVKKVEPETPPPDQASLDDLLQKEDDARKLQDKLEAEQKAEAAAKKKAEADAKKKADADAKKKADAEAKKKQAAAEAKKKKKAEFNVDEISALLNKTDDERTAPQKPEDEAGEPEQAAANVSGTDERLAATLIDALRQKLAGCWNIPPGAREAQLTVKVRFSLDQGGMVTGRPEIVGGSSDPLFGVTAQSAVSAVLECQAYDFLPADQYDLWREITINFNPNQMARS